MSDNKKFLKLHSSIKPHERLNADIAELCKPLTREAFMECFERLGGTICGRCGKRMTEEEGEYRIIYDATVDDPILGKVVLPPQVLNRLGVPGPDGPSTTRANLLFMKG